MILWFAGYLHCIIIHVDIMELTLIIKYIIFRYKYQLQHIFRIHHIYYYQLRVLRLQLNRQLNESYMNNKYIYYIHRALEKIFTYNILTSFVEC